MLNQNIHCFIKDTQLIMKLEKLISIVKEFFSNKNIVSNIELKKFKLSVVNLSRKSPSLFSFHFKRMHRKNLVNGSPPAIQTRKNDGLYFPDPEIFFISFAKIFSLPILLYYKSFFFEQFLRTLTSKNKLRKFGLSTSDKCPVCDIVSNTEHAIFYCIFPKYFVRALALFLDYYYHDNKPQFIFLMENFFLYNIYYEEFSTLEYLQLTQLILVCKDRFLRLSKDEKMRKWSKHNMFAQTLLLGEFTCNMLQYSGIENYFVTRFIEYVLSFRHDVNVFSTE